MATEDRLPRYDADFYDLLFVKNPLPMWIFEAGTGRFLAVNAEACRHYGYGEAEFLGMTIRDILPADELPRLEVTLEAGIWGRRTTGVWSHRTKDGGIIDVDITSDDIVFAGRPARLVLAHDVSELVRSAQALRESNERFRYVTRATNDAIRDWNIVDDAIWWNGGLERVFGRAPDEIAHIEQW
ncbi:MAG TPA: PAS domain S-box protein, partial [Dokdonella sp.]